MYRVNIVFTRPLSPRRSLHTGISILHDSTARLESSVATLNLLGFEHVKAQFQAGSDVTVHRMHNRYLHVDLVEDHRLSSLRKLMSSKALTRVLRVETYPGAANPSIDQLNGDAGHYLANIFSVMGVALNTPPQTTVRHNSHVADQSHIFVPSSSDQAMGVLKVKEIAIPYGDSEGSMRKTAIKQMFTDASLVAHRKFYGVYPADADTTFRLFPSENASIGLALQVEDLANTHAYLKSVGINVSKLGNDLSEPELQLMGVDGETCHLFDALDIRLTQSPDIKPFYREGVAAVLEGTISSIQNTRVLAGDEDHDSSIDSRTLRGDCWVEVKGMFEEKVSGPKGGGTGTAKPGYTMQE